MPNRILKESICSSDSIDALGWFDEVCFYRIIVNCDDYGRMDARPKMLKMRLFPLKDSVTVKNVVVSINTLATLGLVALYEVGGKPLLWLPTWESHQQIRAKKSKCPAPDGNSRAILSLDINGNHMYADAPVIQSESESESEVVVVSARADALPDVADDLSPEDLEMGEVQRVFAECKEFGSPSPTIDKRLSELAFEYGADWLIRAMRVAAVKPDGKRTMGVVAGILRSWKERGRPDDDGPPTTSGGATYTINGRPLAKDEFDAEIRRMREMGYAVIFDDDNTVRGGATLG